jgi:hypothetical protein
VSEDSIGSNIDISVGDLIIENSSAISMALEAEGGGDILITADDITLTTVANIYTSTFEEGEGGNMYLDVNVLEITDQASIEISEFRVAVINAAQSFTVGASDDGSITGIISGDLVLNSPERNLANGSTVIAKNSLSSDALLNGSSSEISITADLLDVLDEAILSADALISTIEGENDSDEEDNIAAIASNRSLRNTELLSKSCHVKALSDRSSFVVSQNATSVNSVPSGYQMSRYPNLSDHTSPQEITEHIAMLDNNTHCL